MHNNSLAVFALPNRLFLLLFKELKNLLSKTFYFLYILGSYWIFVAEVVGAYYHNKAFVHMHDVL